ncbi:glycosyltransferase family 2 protein [Flavobacterium sp. ZB4R12]|uniref:glycosyltransferase family 2 protein n=1 Tax=Flavobacterium sp. ZB4R12 TaxID=3398732 RepID=UPI003AAF5B51
MDVSIIFVNYNTCKLTIESIASVYKYTKKINFEIIVVDNDSMDNSVNEIKNKYPDVNVIKNSKNIGFGQANNKGMEIAKGNYYFLLNTDTYLINNAIEIFFDFLERKENNEIAVVGGHLYKPNGDWNVSSGHFPNFKLFIKGCFWRYFYKKEFYEEEVLNPILINSEQPYAVDYVSGANFFVRSHVIKRVGGFNKRFFLYFEETELTLRIKRILQQSKVYIIPQANIVHIGQGSSLDSIKSLKFKLQYLKSRSLYFKYQNGYCACIMVYIKGLIRIFFKR